MLLHFVLKKSLTLYPIDVKPWFVSIFYFFYPRPNHSACVGQEVEEGEQLSCEAMLNHVKLLLLLEDINIRQIWMKKNIFLESMHRGIVQPLHFSSRPPLLPTSLLLLFSISTVSWINYWVSEIFLKKLSRTTWDLWRNETNWSNVKLRQKSFIFPLFRYTQMQIKHDCEWIIEQNLTKFHRMLSFLNVTINQKRC